MFKWKKAENNKTLVELLRENIELEKKLLGSYCSELKKENVSGLEELAFKIANKQFDLIRRASKIKSMLISEYGEGGDYNSIKEMDEIIDSSNTLFDNFELVYAQANKTYGEKSDPRYLLNVFMELSLSRRLKKEEEKSIQVGPSYA